jgi:ribosomal protein S18 acetylase RimI-like enzyme
MQPTSLAVTSTAPVADAPAAPALTLAADTRSVRSLLEAGRRFVVGSEQKQLTLIADVSRILESGMPEVEGYAVRSVVPGDKAALVKLYHASYTRDLVVDMDDASDDMEKSFGGEFGVLDTDASLVVADGERLVGSILTVENAPWPDTPPGPFIINLFVHPDARRRGLALYMIVAAARTLALKGKATAALRVISDNTGALRLYERLGFRRAEEA